MTARDELALAWRVRMEDLVRLNMRSRVTPRLGIAWVWDRMLPIDDALYAEMMLSPLPFGWSILQEPQP